VKGTVAAAVFEKSKWAIYAAKDSEPAFAELHLDPIPRDKLANKIAPLVLFFAPLTNKSGMLYI
jgi:hypothetical protein